MMNVRIDPSNFSFLKNLEANNNRDWFNANKADYTAAHENTVAMAEAILNKMQNHDVLETVSGKKSIFRIYRDVRFSKNKAPYKTHWGGYLKRAGQERRGGYYFHLEPGGKSFVGGGFWGPNADDLKLIRAQIAQDPDRLREVLNAPAFKKMFGTMGGDAVKTAPKGYAKDHPAIDLLRYKQYLLTTKLTDKQVLSANYPDLVVEAFMGMRPFFDYMSDILTTDLNGESVI